MSGCRLPRPPLEHRAGARIIKDHLTTQAKHAFIGVDPAHLVELNDALELLAKMDSEAAIIAKLRIFVGLSIDEAAKLLNMSRATTYRQWSYARAWLKDALNDDDIGDDVDT